MNSFGSSSLQFALCDPRSVRENRLRFRRDAVPNLDRANSLHVPTGVHPARGWILLERGDYDRLDKYSTTLQLAIGDHRRADNVGTLKNLAIVQAQCVTRGLAASDNALYLVELTDARGILCNKWFQFPLAAQYNIRAPAYPDTLHPASMNSGTTWTWSTMIGDIWSRMSTFLGSYPGLPAGVTPAGTPEGFWFAGVAAWPAMCEVLDHLGLTVACDLTSSTPYTIVSDGAADAGLVFLQGRYVGRLEDDFEYIDVGAGRVPKTVVVLFKRRNAVYGTEETVTLYNDTVSRQWDMGAYYSVTGTAPADFAGAAGTHHIWSDFTVRYDQESNPILSDVLTAQQIAAERIQQYFDRTYSRTSGYMSQMYAGALPFTTGSMVDCVCWSQDYRNNDRQGWRTKITRGDYEGVSYQGEGGD